MKTIHIRKSLHVGWDLFMKRPWYLLGLTLVVGGMFLLASSSNAVITALAYILLGGHLGVMLRYYRHKHIVFDDLFTLDQRWISFAFLALIKGILILLGLLCFVLPGVYLIVRWKFAEIHVIDKGMRPLEALRASSALTSGNRGKLFIFSLVSVMLVIFGLLFFVIGAVIAFIVTLLAHIHIYTTLQTKAEGEAA